MIDSLEVVIAASDVKYLAAVLRGEIDADDVDLTDTPRQPNRQHANRSMLARASRHHRRFTRRPIASVSTSSSASRECLPRPLT